MTRLLTARILAGTSLVLALTAFVLGSAPFTPAMALVFPAVPAALVAAYLGARRLAAIALYWAIAACLSWPLANGLAMRIDSTLLILSGIGIVVAAWHAVGHIRQTGRLGTRR